ncbi:MAG TPA: DUF4262 domain-containing protein [Thermoanaerobaculia bacterium]|nr:DUF4262 domain-containing protein [Thermoanaerobaculia bacterium]
MDAGERKALADIDRYGCHVIHVAAEGDLPPFSYSVGIQRSSGRPEIVVIGLKRDLAHSIVNEYNGRVQDNEVFTPGALYAGFIEGFDVTFETVDRAFYMEYFGWNLWLYSGPEFEVVQLVYPTTNGEWPWQSEVPEWFREWQPILTGTPVSPGKFR